MKPLPNVETQSQSGHMQQLRSGVGASMGKVRRQIVFAQRLLIKEVLFCQKKISYSEPEDNSKSEQ